MQTKTLAGQVTVANLPPHRGLIVSLAFFEVDGPESDPPFGGDPPADAVTDCTELYNEVDFDSESTEKTRHIPFSVEHPPGHFYLQIRTVLLRIHEGEAFAQVEPFFFGRRPLPLLDDVPSVTLPVEWPAIPLEEMGSYGTIKPQDGQ